MSVPLRFHPCFKELGMRVLPRYSDEAQGPLTWFGFASLARDNNDEKLQVLSKSFAERNHASQGFHRFCGVAVRRSLSAAVHRLLRRRRGEHVLDQDRRCLWRCEWAREQAGCDLSSPRLGS